MVAYSRNGMDQTIQLVMIYYFIIYIQSCGMGMIQVIKHGPSLINVMLFLL